MSSGYAAAHDLFSMPAYRFLFSLSLLRMINPAATTKAGITSCSPKGFVIIEYIKTTVLTSSTAKIIPRTIFPLANPSSFPPYNFLSKYTVAVNSIKFSYPNIDQSKRDITRCNVKVVSPSITSGSTINKIIKTQLEILAVLFSLLTVSYSSVRHLYTVFASWPLRNTATK